MTNRLDALARVQVALDDLADALASGRADAVLAAETPLAEATRQLAILTPSSEDGVTRAALRRRVLDTRASLARCHRLGSSMSAVASALFPQPVYGPGPRAGRVTPTVAART